jgi:4a-hydroxytetrahydrobiopterin dehydratase
VKPRLKLEHSGKPVPISQEEIEKQLESLPGWRYQAGSIKKVFKTRGYPATMGFVTAVCGLCQRHNHHPDYILMKFKEVELSFSTHVAGGVTEYDIKVASEIEDKIPSPE